MAERVFHVLCPARTTEVWEVSAASKAEAAAKVAAGAGVLLRLAPTRRTTGPRARRRGLDVR